MANPTWSILGDTDIADLSRCNPDGLILLGEQATGHYLVDPVDIGLDYQTCRAFITARDQYATLVSEAALSTPLGLHFIQIQMVAQRLLYEAAFKTVDAAALTIGPAHFAARFIMP